MDWIGCIDKQGTRQRAEGGGRGRQVPFIGTPHGHGHASSAGTSGTRNLPTPEPAIRDGTLHLHLHLHLHSTLSQAQDGAHAPTRPGVLLFLPTSADSSFKFFLGETTS